MHHRIAVTVDPFGEAARKHLLQLENTSILFNTYHRKMERSEVWKMLIEYNPTIIIAGTERYDAELLTQLPDLQMIARVGVGYESIDLAYCDAHHITVSYGPNTCTEGVASFTVSMMINLLKDTIRIASQMKSPSKWERYIGRDLRECVVGIIGVGRIGTAVLDKLQPFKPRRILLNDIIEQRMVGRPRSEPASLIQLLVECDVVTVHVPGTSSNMRLISENELRMMKANAVLLNFSRGGVVDEAALYKHATHNPQFRAAVDVFSHEPYNGPLTDLSVPNIITTPHLASCDAGSRLKMEIQATTDVTRYLSGAAIDHVLTAKDIQ